jgi:hypothetical protein
MLKLYLPIHLLGLHPAVGKIIAVFIPEPSSPIPQKPLDQLRDAIRLKHYSSSTEKTYLHWARRYMLYHNKRHPA